MLNKTIILCGPTHCNPCCPKFTDKGKYFMIEDDYNDSIKIDKKDINKLIKDVNRILSLHRSSLDTER